MDHPELITIFGGSGFVGTQVVQLLARAGYRIRVAVRRPDLAGHVKPLGGVSLGDRDAQLEANRLTANIGRNAGLELSKRRAGA